MNAIGKSISTKCCYCGMVKIEGQWSAAGDLGDALHSHGCCPVCAVQMMSESECSSVGGTRLAGSETRLFRPSYSRRPIRAAVADAVV